MSVALVGVCVIESIAICFHRFSQFRVSCLMSCKLDNVLVCKTIYTLDSYLQLKLDMQKYEKLEKIGEGMYTNCGC